MPSRTVDIDILAQNTEEGNPPRVRSGAGQVSRVSLAGPLTLLAPVRKLDRSPRRLPPHRRGALFLSKRYRGQYAYLIFVADSEGRIVDARVVKTYDTLLRIDIASRYRGLAILLHPQPIRIPEGFWKEWKQARTPGQRLELVRKHGLAKDEKVFVFTRIILDIDQPYETAEPVVLKVFQKLGIVRGFTLGRSKSGNLRGIVWLLPTTLRIGYEVVGGQRQEVYKSFYLTPQAKHSNGHTHYQNFKEFLAILYGMLEKEGLKVDWSFFDRVNHPIWYSLTDTRFFTPVLSRSGSTRFYTLYNKAKKVQEEEGLWVLPKRGKPFNLTEHFWPQHYRPPKQKEEKRIELPAFVRNELDVLFTWKKAVESLAKRHTSERFLRVIAPAVGWAKYLNLPQHEVESFLEDLLPDKKRDIQIAFRWAKELPFNAPEKTFKPSTYAQKVLDYLQTHGKASRQELLKEVFCGQKWLLDSVMKQLEQKGYVESSTEKREGRGRPFKVYTLTQTQVEESTDLNQDFSQYNNLPQQEEGSDNGLAGDGKSTQENIYVNNPFCKHRASLPDLRRAFIQQKQRMTPETTFETNLPEPPVSRLELRKALFRLRSTQTQKMEQRPEVLRLIESLRQIVYPRYAIEFYSDNSVLCIYLCDDTQAFQRFDVDLSRGLSYGTVLQLRKELEESLSRN